MKSMPLPYLLAQDALELLRQMIAVPSVSRDEQAVADLLQSDLQQRCDALQTDNGEAPLVTRSGNNLWVIAPGYEASRPTLLLNAHLDTVKPSASWQHSPFEPTLEEVTLPDGSTEQRLYGLGANDDGASLVSLIEVFFCLAAHPKGDYNLILLASAEEEVSGRNGIESVLPQLPQIDLAIVGEPTGMHAAIAEKGLMVLDLEAAGRSGHAARNEGINAIYLALDAINALRNYHFERESTTLGPVKVTTTVINAGTAHNVIPDRCTALVDVRTTDAYSNEATLELLRQAAGPSVTLTPHSTRLQPSGIAATHPVVERIKALGRQTFGSPTLSDQALMRFPSVKIGPGDSARSHTADEYIVPAEIEQAIDLYLSLLDGLVVPRTN